MSAFHFSFTNRIRTVSNYKRKLPLSPPPGSEPGQPWGNHGGLLSLARDLGWGEGKALKKDFSLSLKKILKKDHRSKSSYSVFFFKKEQSLPLKSTTSLHIFSWHSFSRPFKLPILKIYTFISNWINLFLHSWNSTEKEKQGKMGEGNK